LNRIKATRFAFALFLICCNYVGFAQTNQGKEFWTAYMSHIQDEASTMVLYITGDVNTAGKVEIAEGNISIPFTVTAKQITQVAVPSSAYIKQQGQFMRGIHITSLKKIAVYAHIYANNVSGATLLLPVNVLGKDYYSLNYTQASNQNALSYSAFMVVAVEDDTAVEITPSAALLDGKSASFVVNLKKGEVYQALSRFDLSGSRVRAISSGSGECKRIAVFAGSTKIGIGCEDGQLSSDNLFQQVYPISAWGKNYITVPLKNRNYDIFRVFFSSANTTLKIDGKVISPTAYNNLYYEFPSQKTNTITADKPIQVAQYAVTQGKQLGEVCDAGETSGDLGDPEMIYLNPLEQTLDHVALYSSPNANILASYINIVIKTTAKETFMLDGQPFTGFTPLNEDPTYSYAQINVANGTHYINAADGFNAIAYGFGDHESYGYSAGTNLKNLNESVAFKDPLSSKIQINGCAGSEYKLQLTLPFETGQIRWAFNDGSAAFTDNDPVVTSTVTKEAVTLYTYEYPKIVKYPLGEYSITATVLNPVADECGSSNDIDFDFTISDYPVPKFSFITGCPGDVTYFKDETSVTNSAVKKWQWDFGDGKTSELQNPEHIFTNPGSYNVVLTVSNENECSSTTQPQTIVIAKKPDATFTISAPGCVGQEVTFTDRSVIAVGKIAKRIWDFSDGTTETYTDDKPFTHVFAVTGKTTIKLIVVAESGCESVAATQEIDIFPLPEVDFIMPEICIEDNVAQFTDATKIADGSEAGFTYLWNFGDDRATAQNPNTSTIKNARHSYTRADNYKVTLTVTLASGCSVTKEKEFTVNGAIPNADFTVESPDGLCSNAPVIFTEAATLTFGRLTKVIWYYDWKNNQQDAETFTGNNIPASRKYNHTYALFNSPATKTYTVRMEVYSGQTCMNVMEHDVTVSANPLVNVQQIEPICQEAQSTQITVDKNGYEGTAVFSGKGVNTNGVFNPAAAGPGVTTITCTFTDKNSCTYVTSQDITVYPTPTADASRDLILLEGESVLINATASGDNLSYKWTPSTGLDLDNVLKPVSTATDNITYTLTVTTGNDCQVVDQVYIKVLKKLNIANAFTPNGDGVNDTFQIKYLESYPGNTVDIYNRYGEKVYSSVGYGVPWDGRYKGTDLPAGTYYYIINPKNGRKTVSGSVTIIR